MHCSIEDLACDVLSAFLDAAGVDDEGFAEHAGERLRGAIDAMDIHAIEEFRTAGAAPSMDKLVELLSR